MVVESSQRDVNHRIDLVASTIESSSKNLTIANQNYRKSHETIGECRQLFWNGYSTPEELRFLQTFVKNSEKTLDEMKDKIVFLSGKVSLG